MVAELGRGYDPLWGWGENGVLGPSTEPILSSSMSCSMELPFLPCFFFNGDGGTRISSPLEPQLPIALGCSMEEGVGRV